MTAVASGELGAESQVGPVGTAAGEQPEVDDRGPFTHAVCRRCGWSGPGRRSRGLARKDGAGHTCPT